MKKIHQLIPLTIINAIGNKSLPVYGKGDNIRDWLYVDDHCNAIWTVLNNGTIGTTYNIGGNQEMKNIDTVINICNQIDNILPRNDGSLYSDLITFVKDRPGHDFRYAIDANKIRSELGWAPKESFESGIKKTINWYINNTKWWQNIKNNNYQQERLGLIKE